MTEREALEWMTDLARQMRGLLKEASNTFGWAGECCELHYRGEPDEQTVPSEKARSLCDRIDELLANTTPKEGE